MEKQRYLIGYFRSHFHFVWNTLSMNTDHIKTGNFPIIRPLALHDLEVNLDVTVFGCRDMRRFNTFEHVCHLLTSHSNHANYTLGTVCFVLLRSCSQVISTGLVWKPWRKMVWSKFWFLGMIGCQWHPWFHSGCTKDLLKSSVEPPKCAEALLVLDTDGGRLAVKYNSLARKDSIFCHFFPRLSFVMRTAKNKIGSKWFKLLLLVFCSWYEELWPSVKQQVAFEKRVFTSDAVEPLNLWESASVAQHFFCNMFKQPDTKVINKLPKPSATRSDVDVAVIDDYTVIFQVPKRFLTYL